MKWKYSRTQKRANDKGKAKGLIDGHKKGDKSPRKLLPTTCTTDHGRAAPPIAALCQLLSSSTYL